MIINHSTDDYCSNGRCLQDNFLYSQKIKQSGKRTFGLMIFGDDSELDPEKVFLDALADAGVTGGKRANKAQAAKAIKYMEAL